MSQDKPGTGRLTYIDAAKGLGILMIMFGHITDIGNPVDTWMSSFKVSIFYVITGFLYAHTQSPTKRTPSQFAGRILQSEFVPYLWFCSLGALFKALCVLLKHKGRAAAMATLVTKAADTVFLKGINSLWFIPTMIIGAIVFYWILRVPKPLRIAYALAGPFVITLSRHVVERLSVLTEMGLDLPYEAAWRLTWAFGKGFSAAWFIGAGYLLHGVFVRTKERPASVRAALGISLCLINLFLSQANRHVDFNQLHDGDRPFLFYLCGLVGSFGVILLLDLITENHPLEGLQYLGRNSLTIMATHTVFGLKTVAYKGWESVAYIPDKFGLEYLCECLVVLVILVGMEYAVIELVNRRCPFLLGKGRILR